VSAGEDPNTSELQRIDGRLHFIHHIRDDQGNVITTVNGPLKVEFRLADFGQLVAGACVMALPVALTEEVWDLGETLSLGRTMAILIVSVLTLASFVWGLSYGTRITQYPGILKTGHLRLSGHVLPGTSPPFSI